MARLIQKIRQTQNYWLGPVLVIVLSVLAYFPLLKPGYFSMHDDLQVMRLFQMEKCFLDGQLPCRWVPDLGAGFGQPMYNFYPVLPYYLGMFFRLFNLSFVDISKILFFLSLVFSGVFMYLLTKEFFGKLAGIVGALFYVYAPYHAVDIYVRGALTESWAIVFFPLIFWSLYKFIKEEKLSFFILSIFSLALLFLSHNVLTLIFTPVAFFWGFYWIVVFQKWKAIFKLIVVFVWAGGLAAFFVLPAFLEKSLVKIETLTSDYYNFRQHFVTVKQLFWDRSFGWGPSRPGPIDDMSFQLGWPHWWIVIVSVFLAIYLFLKKKGEIFYSLVFFIGVFLFTIFMTHAKSVYIWEAIPVLSFVQFPWRFISIAMFASSFLAAGVIILLRESGKILGAVFLVSLVIGLNAGYFRPEKNYPSMNDQQKVSGEEWRAQSMAALLDYLPKQVKEIPRQLAPETPWAVEGEARITEFRKRSNFWRFTVEVITSQPVLISVPIFDFPRWVVLIDQKEASYSADNPWGVITVVVPSGKHTVVGWFRNTPLRKAANIITSVAFAALILLIVINDRRTKNEEK